MNIEDQHHLMRFAPFTQQEIDPDTDEFLGILGSSFSVRESDDGGISLTWVEHYGQNDLETYGRAASHFRDTLKKKKLPGKGVFAIGSAGDTRDVCSKYNKKIRIVHAPDGANHGHAEIRRFSDNDRRLLDVLATEVYLEHVMVSSLKQIHLPAECCSAPGALGVWSVFG